MLLFLPRNVTYIDTHNERHNVTFQELRRLVDEDKQQAKHNHNLIKIVAGGKANKENLFKLMSPTELEIAVRKARATHSHVCKSRLLPI